MKLGPSLTQILIYFAFPRTPFHEQVVAEKRYLPEYQRNPDLRRWDGFSMHFEHPKFSAPELEALQKELYKQDFERLGPSIVRLVRVWFEGYKNLRHSSNPLLRARAEEKWELVRSALPGIVPAMLFGPNRKARLGARALFREARKEMGSLSAVARLKCIGSPILAIWTSLANRLRVFQQPGLLRIEHRSRTVVKRQVSVMRLQGGFQANPIAALAEDLNQNVRDLWTHVFPKRDRFEEEFLASAVTRLPDSGANSVEGAGRST